MKENLEFRGPKSFNPSACCQHNQIILPAKLHLSNNHSTKMLNVVDSISMKPSNFNLRIEPKWIDCNSSFISYLPRQKKFSRKLSLAFHKRIMLTTDTKKCIEASKIGNMWPCIDSCEMCIEIPTFSTFYLITSAKASIVRTNSVELKWPKIVNFSN